MADLDTWVKIPWSHIYRDDTVLTWLYEYKGIGVFCKGGHVIFFSHSEDAVMFSLFFT